MSSVMEIKTKFLAEEAKEISQPQTEVVAGLGTGQDLEDERMRRVSVFFTGCCYEDGSIDG